MNTGPVGTGWVTWPQGIPELQPKGWRLPFALTGASSDQMHSDQVPLSYLQLSHNPCHRALPVNAKEAYGQSQANRTRADCSHRPHRHCRACDSTPETPATAAAAPARATFLTRGSGERTPRAGSELGNKQGSQGALHMGKQEPRHISHAQNMCFPVPPKTVSGSLSGFRHFPQGAETGRCDSSLHSTLPRPRAHAARPRVPGTTVLAELQGANSHAMRGGAGAE